MDSDKPGDFLKRALVPGAFIPLPDLKPETLSAVAAQVAQIQPADRFAACLPFTLAQECPLPDDWSNAKNFSDDAHDPGGKTMCGIIQREYDHFRKSERLPVRDVRKLTQEEGHTIYRENYWEPHCPALPAGLDLCFFDASVNMGSFEAVRLLQVALGIANDGEWGPATSAAAAAIKDVTGVIQAFTKRREQVYRQMKGFKWFGTDWLRRADEIEDHALAMRAANPTPPAGA